MSHVASVGPLRSAALVFAGAAALAGCAHGPMPPAADAPWSARWPAVLGTVIDARTEFAALFDAEIARRPGVETPPGEPVRPWSAAPLPKLRPDPVALEAVERRFAERAAGTLVLIVPGLFGDCVAAQSVPFGDGVLRTPERSAREAYAQYADLGLRGLRMVPLPGRASSEANGERLAAAIESAAAEPGVRGIVLVGYSKGVADALHAVAVLEQRGTRPASLEALVSVAGVVSGTPLVDQYHGLYDAVARHVDPLDCTGSQGGELDSLSPALRTAWLQGHHWPADVATYSVTAIADPQTMAWPLRWTWRELARLDPRNDGQVMARDAVLPASRLLAEVRADHWAVALPRERHPSAFWRWLASPEPFPREAMLRAILKTVVAGIDAKATDP